MSAGSFGYIDEGSFKRLSQQLRRAENAPEPENREREEPGQVPYYVEFMGKLNATLHSSAESTGAEASIWAAHSDHEPKDTTRDVTVYPWFLRDGELLREDTTVTVGSLGGKLYVTNPQHGFLRCRAQIATTSSTGSTFPVDNIVALEGSSPTTSSSDTVTAENTHDWDVSDNEGCRIEWNQSSKNWEIYAIDKSTNQQARWLRFTASDDFLTGGAISIDARTYHDGDAPETDITSIANPDNLTGYDNGTGTAIIDTDDSPPTYTAVSVAPVAEEVITDFNVNTTTFKLQKKLRDISIMPRGDESTGWVDIHTGTECT